MRPPRRLEDVEIRHFATEYAENTETTEATEKREKSISLRVFSAAVVSGWPLNVSTEYLSVVTREDR
jgi:hypothetical protein